MNINVDEPKINKRLNYTVGPKSAKNVKVNRDYLNTRADVYHDEWNLFSKFQAPKINR